MNILCKLGIHKPYEYMPRTSCHEDFIACKRCGYGRTLYYKWTITPEEVNKSTAQEAEFEYGRMVGIIGRLCSDSKSTMQIAFDCIKSSGKFTQEELYRIKKDSYGVLE